ncbi:hypothetical protein [Ferruginibacter sp.]
MIINFFNNTTAWIKGEVFESILIFIFGLLTIVCGLLFWKFGVTLNAKALILPLITAGLIYIVISGSLYISNQKRLQNFQQKFITNKVAFIQAEKKRVEDFQYMYSISKVVATLFFIVTLCIFWFTKNASLQGWGIGLTIFAIAGLIVDYFSQERAEIYYKVILDTISETGKPFF